MTKRIYPIVWVQLIASYLLATAAMAQAPAPQQAISLQQMAPDIYLIEEIQVSGNKTLDSEGIIALLGLRAGDAVEIPGPSIQDAIQRLWKHKVVQDVSLHASKVEGNRIILTVNITESLRLSDCFIAGVKKKERAKLMDKIPIAKGKIITEELIGNSQKIIEDYLVEEGYLHAVVEMASLPDPALEDHIQVTIKIEKGQKLKICSVKFEGNEQIGSDVLRGQMQHIREKSRFTLLKDMVKRTLMLQPIWKGGILWRPLDFEEIGLYFTEHVIPFSSAFEEEKFEQDKKRIISYYQSQGFRDAAIVDEGVDEEEDGLLTVFIKVEEGKQYRIGAIKWVGNYRHDSATLHQVLGIKKGDIYNPVLLQQRLYSDPGGRDIASLYSNDGHLFFQAEPVEVGLEGDVVAIEIRIHEGPQARIKKILIAGNKWTHGHVIRRELTTLPGDKFSKVKVQRSYRDLAMLDIFDPAIEIVPIPNYTDKTVDIRYKVKDRPKFEIKATASLGGGNQDTMFSATVATNNFSLGNLFGRPIFSKVPLGAAQSVGITAEFNTKAYKNFSLQFMEPWLMGHKPSQLHLSLSASFEEERKSVGGRMGLGIRLPWLDYATLRGGTAYYRHYFKNHDLLFQDEQRTGHLNDLTFNLSLERNSTDSPIFPTEGTKVGLHVTATPPISAFSSRQESALSNPMKYRWKEYHQWMLDASCFLRIVDDLVLNLRGHVGLLGSFSKKGIGPFQRFYMGGSGHPDRALRGKEIIGLRGYEDGHITPKDEVTGYQGGVIYDKFVAELRYPVFSSYIASAYALAFVEAGNTWSSYKDFNPLLVKKSVGVGLRVHLPFIIGTTVGFDWGLGLDQEQKQGEAELMLQWSIGMGTTR